jgi:hypothetical protein
LFTSRIDKYGDMRLKHEERLNGITWAEEARDPWPPDEVFI